MEYLADGSGALAAILAFVPGGQLPAAAAGLVSGLARAANKYLDDTWLLAPYATQKIWFTEWIPAIGEELGGAADEAGERTDDAFDKAGEEAGDLIEDLPGPLSDLEGGLVESGFDKAGDYAESAGDVTEAGIETATDGISEAWEKADDWLP
ncbi:MAG: hypothetical protein GEV00_23380 [Actinophytocola sp.]|nr:hypothetical protein [Actinophytocola sp.]